MLELIASFFHFVGELDAYWIGFRALRPARHEDMTAQLVARMALFYAPAAAIYTALILKVGSDGHAPASQILLPAFFAGALVCVLKSLTAYFWNQRAARLRRLRALTVGREPGV
jgi:hypothetical protein